MRRFFYMKSVATGDTLGICIRFCAKRAERHFLKK